MAEEPKKKRLWSSTLTKLKVALSRTKSAIVESAVGEEGAPASQDASGAAERQVSTESNIQNQTSSAASSEVGVPAGSEGESAFWNNFIKTAKSLDDDSMSTEAESKSATTAELEISTPAAKMQSRTSVESSPSIVIDEEYLEDLEEKLIKADLGLANAETLITNLRAKSRGKKWTRGEVIEFLRVEFLNILRDAPSARLKYEPGKLNIYLVVGVNGTGKTTSIGKLCWKFKQEGKRVLMAAGDTFRAAAETQLEIWSGRAGVDIERLDLGADPGAVVFKAVDRAKAEGYDCLVIDTAGRLHNKTNLMDELKKIRGVIEKRAGDLPLEVLLVIDASTGQNGMQQAKVFTEVCSLTGVILTKLDGTAKGGIVFSIARDLDIPVKLIGLGEQIDDLRDFDPELFVQALC